ncbi:hypothetical protein [Streptomyces sp. NPDC051546]|uniref:hypothetical protein n=1 Tax=Streptomyces sp. NPDC051546 TaxID=3365655 RepID=UPI0037A5DD50
MNDKPSLSRAAINLGQGVYVPGLIRKVEGDQADLYRGQALRDWYPFSSLLTSSLIPLNVTGVLTREWERLELWLAYDRQAGREPIDPSEQPKSVNLHKHTCRTEDCMNVAGLLVSDGFCAYFVCITCERHPVSLRHRSRYPKSYVLPIAQATCNPGCVGR